MLVVDLPWNFVGEVVVLWRSARLPVVPRALRVNGVLPAKLFDAATVRIHLCHDLYCTVTEVIT